MGTTDPQPFGLPRTPKPATAQAAPDSSPGEADSTRTDQSYRNGKARWEIAKLPRGEWERARASNDRELAETEPGSGTFARLMEARHRLALPPPEGIALDDISRYAQRRVREQFEAAAEPEKARKRRAMLMIGVLSVLGLALVLLLVARLSGSSQPAATQVAAPPGPTVSAPVVVVPSTAAPTPAQQQEQQDSGIRALDPGSASPAASAAPIKVAPAVGKIAPPTPTATAIPAKPAPTGDVFFDTRR